MTGEEEEKMADDARHPEEVPRHHVLRGADVPGDRISETLTGEAPGGGEHLRRRLGHAGYQSPGGGQCAQGRVWQRGRAGEGAARRAARGCALAARPVDTVGFRPVEVLEAIQTCYQGTVVAQTHRGNQVADVAVILDEKNRQDPEVIGSLLLRSPQGGILPLHELAEIYPTSGRAELRLRDSREHSNRHRTLPSSSSRTN